MGVKLVKWAIGQRAGTEANPEGLSDGEWGLLMIYAEAAKDGDPRCWPGDPLVAATLAVSTKTVERRRAVLVAKGLVSVKERERGKKESYDTITVLDGRKTPDTSLSGTSQPSTRQSGTKYPTDGDEVPDKSGRALYRNQKNSNQKNNNHSRARDVPEVESEPVTSAERDLAAVVADPVTDAERDIAEVAVAEFKKHAGWEPVLIDREGKATKHLALIVARIRDDPHLSGEDHKRIIARCFADPIWLGSANNVAVIYKADQWPIAKGRKRKKAKSYERDLDDPGRAKPPW